MSKASLTQCPTPVQRTRSEARERGISWSAVKDAYNELLAREVAKRERANEVRQTAWVLARYHVPRSWGFWRHGFSALYGQRYERGDVTAIPCYDTLAQEIASQFPEYADDDGTERLWAFLMSPYDKLPARETLYEQALEIAARELARGNRNTQTETVPF